MGELLDDGRLKRLDVVVLLFESNDKPLCSENGS